MSIEVKVPMLPESVADATILNWHKQPGDQVKRDEVIVELETDKVVLEVPAPDDGVLDKVLQGSGAVVKADETLAIILAAQSSEPQQNTKSKNASTAETNVNVTALRTNKGDDTTFDMSELSPAVRRLVAEHELDITKIKGTGKNGRLVKEDILAHLEAKPKSVSSLPLVKKEAPHIISSGEREERRVPMSRLRAKIAERLVEAQHNAAMLTTFNEINLQAIMDLREKYKDGFEKRHGVKLGFMSFFTKAAVEALKQFPAVNASIDGNDIIYHGYYDIGIAVSTERGLVVPVMRDVEQLSMADIEKSVADFAVRARNNKLGIEELQGGTFTITNGGVFGSLMATPIINPPQVGILGMHKIESRPVVEDGEIVIRPMMYVALSYDHRIIDGKESVQFLVTIKNLLEDPRRLLLDV